MAIPQEMTLTDAKNFVPNKIVVSKVETTAAGDYGKGKCSLQILSAMIFTKSELALHWHCFW